jgi:hypothetical protein
MSTEAMLFDSLVHHLVEKGLLTKNDALSVVAAVASCRRGKLEELKAPAEMDADFAMLQRLYASFECLSERHPVVVDGEKVRFLRPPLHEDHPEFPQDN